jgi:Glycosyl transferase family 2
LSGRESSKSGTRLVMAMKVRDEGDILEANLRFHHALGVDHFVVTDNGSTDETRDILKRYADAGLAHVTEEPGTDYRVRGAGWLTEMARTAATELAADWVIHTDADEFWLPIEGSLKDTFGEIPDRYGVVHGPRVEFVGRPDGPGGFADRLTIREARSRLQPKVAHRAEADVISLDRGPHDVAAEGESGDVMQTLRPPGRPVHRTVRDADGPGPVASEDLRLVWAPVFTARILHFPVRSFAQFKRRTEVAIYEGHYPDVGRFKRLRELYEQGRFEELYSELVLDDEDVAEGIRDGRLVRDERFAKLLARSPDPLDGGSAGTVRVEPTAEEVERERSELEFDAMQVLGRSSRWAGLQRDRNRERGDELQADLRRVKQARAKASRKLTRQREALKGKRKQLRREQARVERVRRKLRAERRRPWSRLRKRFRGVRRRLGRVFGQG